MKKIAKRIVSDTPHAIKIFQAIVVGLGLLPTYVESLPIRFQDSIPDNVITYISYAAIASVVLLQIINKKE